MSVVNRGVRNAFRNLVRTFSIVIILGLSIGLTIVMLVARQAVASRIDSVKSSIGNTVTIQPSGGGDFGEAGNALTTTQLDKVSSTSHITKLTENLTDRLSTTGSAQVSFGGRSVTDSGSTTSLTSPVQLNTNGNGGGRTFIRGGGRLPANFTPPVSFLGTTDPSSLNDNPLKISDGQAIDGAKDSNDAMISTDMASKNNLKAGSSFQAYNTSLAVVGIFDSGTQGGNNTVILSLPALQRLSGQAGAVTSATATVDSVDNLAATTSAVQNLLGSNADVQNSQDQVQNAIQPLNNIKTISTYSLFGAVAAGAAIILLTMLMIVRERRREIGVLKAIGASNLKVVGQFIIESITFTVLGALAGLGVGVATAGPITQILVASGQSQPNSPATGGFRGGGFRAGGFGRAANVAVGNLRSLHVAVGWQQLGYGLAAALAIAVIGSAVPAFLIAKVRPAEVMRAE